MLAPFARQFPRGDVASRYWAVGEAGLRFHSAISVATLRLDVEPTTCRARTGQRRGYSLSLLVVYNVCASPVSSFARTRASLSA